MAVDRSHNADYLQKQHRVMVWLYEQGISVEDIREMTWGSVDEEDKTFSLVTEVVHLQYDRESGLVKRDVSKKKIVIPLRGSEHEWFFLKSRIFCRWMFTRERPKTWRPEGSRDSLYSLSDIHGICGKLGKIDNINALTNGDLFGTIEVSKMNITKMKTEELNKAAIQV